MRNLVQECIYNMPKKRKKVFLYRKKYRKMEGTNIKNSSWNISHLQGHVSTD